MKKVVKKKTTEAVQKMAPTSAVIQAKLDEIMAAEAAEEAELKAGLGLPRLSIKTPDTWPAKVAIIDRRGGLRRYYAKPFEPGSHVPPDCSSRGNGKGNGFIIWKGERVDHVNFPCAQCPMNQFGSAKTGRAKACAENTLLVVHRNGAEEKVEMLNIPVMSNKALSDYLLTLIKANRKRLTTWTELSVKHGEKYDQFVFTDKGEITNPKLIASLIDSYEASKKIDIDPGAFDSEPTTENSGDDESDA